MFQGKTKHGVSIRQTRGMRDLDNRSCWVLTVDRSQLRLFEFSTDEFGKRVDLAAFYKNPDGKKKISELLSDRPGRSFDRQNMGDGGGTRHAYGNPSNIEEQIMGSLVTRALGLLEEFGLKEKAARLSVLAGPKLLGRLRHAVSEALPKTELSFMEKDFAWMATPLLTQHILEMENEGQFVE